MILYERYVEPFFGPSNENEAIISRNIDKLKEFYERKVLDWKYLRPKENQRSLPTRNNSLNAKSAINNVTKYKPQDENQIRFNNLKLELNNVLSKRSVASQPQRKKSGEEEKLDIDPDIC